MSILFSFKNNFTLRFQNNFLTPNKGNFLEQITILNNLLNIYATFVANFKVKQMKKKMSAHAGFSCGRNFEGCFITWHPVVVYIEINFISVWPYTLLYRMPHKCHGNANNCPSRSHPIWELPINELDRRDDPDFDETLSGCHLVSSCSNVYEREQFRRLLNYNFDR